jgi:hypothetical protein
MMDKENQAELGGKLMMDALAPEIGQLKDQPAGRAELIQQIGNLARMSHVVRRSKIMPYALKLSISLVVFYLIVIRFGRWLFGRQNL